ncbi:hypothetical protein TNCV_3979351, partial [Trichonephila clavipes]
MVSAFSRSKPTLKMCGVALGRQAAGRETILRETRTPSSVHSQRRWDKLPHQLLDNVVQ